MSAEDLEKLAQTLCSLSEQKQKALLRLIGHRMGVDVDTVPGREHFIHMLRHILSPMQAPPRKKLRSVMVPFMLTEEYMVAFNADEGAKLMHESVDRFMDWLREMQKGRTKPGDSGVVMLEPMELFDEEETDGKAT